MTDPRPWTADEISEQIIERVWSLARYWAGLDGSNVDAANRPPLDLITGFAHSFLVMLDGCSMDMPCFKLVPDPHPEDEAYCRQQGENWYSPDTEVEVMLHELLYREDLRRDE